MMKMMRTEVLLLAAVLFTSSLVSVTSADSQSLPRKLESRDGVDRREVVKDAMLLAWSSYEKFAWGFDELQPKTKDGVDSLGGVGATIVDALDTLFIMGLHDEFNRARKWVATSLDVTKDTDVSVFETTIRVVGGLLSAYDLSGDEMFLQKATEVADRLLPAWDTPSGVPLNRINLGTGVAHNYDSAKGSILADIGTEQLEFIALSERTNDKKYQQKVENVISVLHKNFPADGLLPVFIDPDTGLPVPSTITFGAMGDSFYEYLLKAWVQGNKTQAVSLYREMWETSITKGMQSLIRETTPSGYSYICEKNGDVLSDTMDELACFTGGMLALGSSGFADLDQAKRTLALAEELAKTCYNFYDMTTTKLAGENYAFSAGQDMILSNPYNVMRPETVESLFYLWRFTKNDMYRDWGWNIFQAFEQHSRLTTGYVGLTDVNSGDQDNTQQSFFLAETLKYFYLLFSDPTVIPLDEWVFNTEAHPLKIVTRTTAFEGSNRREPHGRKQSPGRGRKHR